MTKEKVDAPGVLVVGPVFVDMIYSGLTDAPELGKEVFCDDFKITVGGLAITAIGLARLDVPVYITSMIGGDYFGKLILKYLEEEGVNCNWLIKKQGCTTSNTTVLSFHGDRAFVTKRGAEVSEAQLLKYILKYDLKEIKHIHVIMEKDILLYQYIKEIKTKYPEIKVSIVAAWEGVEFYKNHQDYLNNLLMYSDLFFCIELEAMHLMKKENVDACIDDFSEFNARPVITLGKNGAVTLDESQKKIELPVLDVNFFEATGAGDSFAAGFIAGSIQGFSVSKSLKLGIICGSKSTEGLGGTGSFPTINEVEKLLGR